MIVMLNAPMGSRATAMLLTLSATTAVIVVVGLPEHHGDQAQSP
eukprot:CAMPEP_0119547064 /NCGR_PEP_ID=MMETSP1352-20130426/1276_1 /TAXON_ID=265584 /ORGANISM="Stauroneis constricta, Strain CCMP1120" /LENGTH=43 /DNA_ID= /DNA_START= /DNA_END= /DNA_ORIENTATION=